MRKLFTLLFSSLTIVSVYSQQSESYSNNIAENKLLIQFNATISAVEKESILDACPFVQEYYHIPFPALSSLTVSNRKAAEQYFKNKEQIESISFYLTNHQGHYAGVLNSLFIKLKDDNFSPMLREKLNRAEVIVTQKDAYVPRLYKITLSGNSELNAIDFCTQLSSEAWCEYASPNYLLQPLVNTTDPLYSRQWALSNEGTSIQGNGIADADMDVDSAWMVTTGSINIKISIIDSGVDTLHPDLIDNILPGYDALGDTTDGYPTPTEKEDGHGTCCAGIVAASQNNIGTSGVAPSCKIVPVRAFYYVKPQGSAALPLSTSEAFANAIGWSWKVAGADIMNNSWGLPANLIGFLPGGVLPVEDAIQTAADSGRLGKGAVLFFSSGNENDSMGPIWPGKLPKAISVNATTMCDEHKNPNDCSGESWGGNYGGNLDFSAPGVKVATTDMQGLKGFINGSYYNSFNGTSAACPNAAGVGALVLSVRPDLSAESVRHVLAITCQKVGGYAYDSARLSGTWSNELGYGRLNAFQAVQFAQTYTSVKETVVDNHFVRLYPNPAHGQVVIESNWPTAQIKLYNVSGQIVQTAVLENNRATFIAENLPKGIYWVQLSNNNQLVTKKLVVD